MEVNNDCPTLDNHINGGFSQPKELFIAKSLMEV